MNINYCQQFGTSLRLDTLEVKVGNIGIGGKNPIRIQTMTTTNTLDTEATVAQAIRCIEAGAELIRVTAPSKKEAENLLQIKKLLRQKGYQTPLIADIHYTPNAAEIAAQIVEKVRINPGNYIDKKKFETITYSNNEYELEVEKISQRFLPLVKICKREGTAMRIGTNHGSLSDRILSRYGDTPIGMVESAMEFLRIALSEQYQQIVLSMKASNPLIMVQAYRVLVQKMKEEFGFCFPLHLGVTEAGDGEDGRIKSAIGIGTLLEDGIGDTIRVSLTEDPEFEIPVCKDIVSRYENRKNTMPAIEKILYNPYEYKRNKTLAIDNMGAKNLPIVVADFSRHKKISFEELGYVGYNYNPTDDKWNIKDNACDYVLLDQEHAFDFPQSLKCIVPVATFTNQAANVFPLFSLQQWKEKKMSAASMNFVEWNIDEASGEDVFPLFANEKSVVFIVTTKQNSPYLAFRTWAIKKQIAHNELPFIWKLESIENATIDKQLIHFATELGALFLDGFGDGLCLYANHPIQNMQATGRTYLEITHINDFLNQTAFSILQATRTRMSKTEYISCPSCGRTQFDLQTTTTKIRNATKHLKGLKIGVMGCIVNGPGEMADADFGYVGSGVGKIHLYKEKEIVKKNIDASVAVEELIQLIKDNGRWND